MALEFSYEKTGTTEQRFVICYIVILSFFLIVTLRLFYLQVIRGRFFWAFSAEHTMKEIRIPATRGVIYDRHRIAIAENRASFDLTLVPQHIRDREKVKQSLQQVGGVDPNLVEMTWHKAWRTPSYVPITIVSDIPYDQAVRIRTAKAIEFDPQDPIDLRGVEVMARPLRSYPLGPVAATTLGYIGEISEKVLSQFQKEEPGRYFLGDLVGAAGLERHWEQFLHGQDGYLQKIVDAVGREIIDEDLSTLLQQEEAVHGHNLILTIDSRLQQFAEQQFVGKAGALVVIDPRNGEILAMVSQPSYDPVALVSNVSHDDWTTLVSGPGHLLLNRAIQGTYPPGSTYKIVTAIAGLEEKVIKPDETIFCGGGLQYGNRFFKCWRKGGHGAISVRRAIAESCDTFFYQVGLRLGVDRLAKYATMLGFGKKTGIDLDGEKEGTIPTSAWKKKVLRHEWQTGENISIAVGQGYNTVTPLQNALMVAQVGIGKKLTPHLVMAVEDEEGEIVHQKREGEEEGLPVSDEALRIVREGMLGAVGSPGGTAHRLRSSLVKMAGKTGTAQVMSEQAKGRVRAGVETRDHAWFVSYAPYEDPQIAVSVLVEHGGFGAAAAAPIAKAVIEKYYESRRIQ